MDSDIKPMVFECIKVDTPNCQFTVGKKYVVLNNEHYTRVREVINDRGHVRYIHIDNPRFIVWNDSHYGMPDDVSYAYFEYKPLI